MPALSSAAMSSDGMPHALQGQCALGRMAPDHFRHIQVVAVFPEAAQHAGIGAFALQVQLGGQGVLDLGHHFARTDLVGAWMGALDQRGQRIEQGDVGVDLLLDARAKYLDHHLAAIGQRRRVHLCDRGRGQRFGVEAGEGRTDRQAERVLDDAARGLAIERLDPVLQQGQFIGHVRWHQVAAGGQDLAELDEDRAEVLQRRRRRAPRDCAAMSAEARGTNGLARRNQRSAGVPCSRSSRR